MNVSRDVIIDLLPLYLAGEASEDTRQLVEHFLADDPALAKLAEQAKVDNWNGEIPVPLQKEDEMKSFEKTKSLLFQQKLFLTLSVGTTLLFIAFRFDENGVEWLWINSPQLGWGIFMTAALFWTAFLNVNWQLNRTE
ncbi:MAG: zf-HC2 domain-containing protein [Anaerolineaceae bacterium]|nr:zf-HC2 domain-containing protein [Anaerolineaceae bacterium]